MSFNSKFGQEILAKILLNNKYVSDIHMTFRYFTFLKKYLSIKQMLVCDMSKIIMFLINI